MYWSTDLMLVLTFRSNTVKKVNTAARIAASRSQEPGGDIDVFDMVSVKLDSSENIDMKISLTLFILEGPKIRQTLQKYSQIQFCAEKKLYQKYMTAMRI